MRELGYEAFDRGEEYSLKEMAVGIKTSPYFRDYMKEVDVQLPGGSVGTKLMRSLWYGMTGSRPDAPSVLMEELVNDVIEDNHSSDPTKFGVLMAKLGSPQSERSTVEDYREDNPAVSASLPKADAAYVKTAVPAKWDHPTMGIKSRPRLGAAAWLLPNGRMLPANPDKNEWHETIVRKAFPKAPEWTDEGGIPINTAEALALKSGWVRVTIERDSIAGTTLWYAASTPLGGLSSKQRSIIKDWAAMQDVDLANVKYDAEPLKEALTDLAAAKRAGRLDYSSMSLPAYGRIEAQDEIEFWSKQSNELSVVREAARRLGVVVVVDDVDMPQVSEVDQKVLLVSDQEELQKPEFVREMFRSSFKSTFSSFDRKQALRGMGEFSPEVTSYITSLIVDAGSYEKLLSNIVTQAVLGDESPTKFGEANLQSAGNQILAGAFGDGARQQLQTMLDVAGNAWDVQFSEVASTNGYSNWDEVHHGIDVLGLQILPETIPNLREAADDQNITITELLEQPGVDPSLREQVAASLSYQEQKASSLVGAGADYQLSLIQKDRSSRSLAAGDLADLMVGSRVIEREKVNAGYLFSKLGLPAEELVKLKDEVDQWAYDDVMGAVSAAEFKERKQELNLSEEEVDTLVEPLVSRLKKFPNSKLSDEADYNLSLVLRDPLLVEISDISSLKQYIKSNYGGRSWASVALKLFEAIENNSHEDESALGIEWDPESPSPFYNLRENKIQLNLAGSPRSLLHELSHAGTSKWVHELEYRVQKQLEASGRGDNSYREVLDTLLEDDKTPVRGGTGN